MVDITKLQIQLVEAIYKRAAGEMSGEALRITYEAILKTAESGGFTKEQLFAAEK